MDFWVLSTVKTNTKQTTMQRAGLFTKVLLERGHSPSIKFRYGKGNQHNKVETQSINQSTSSGKF